MEEAATQIVVSETQQVESSVSPPFVGTSSGDIPDAFRKTIKEIKTDNALVKECLDKQDMMFN